MKSISRSLSLRSSAPWLLFPTNTFRPSSTLHLTYNYRHLSTVMPPPPPKRKWNRPRPSSGAPNVKAMYSTAAGNAEAKKFSEMAGKLDKSLLLGLEKMGFECVYHRHSPPT
jgi:hypothetical protein